MGDMCSCTFGVSGFRSPSALSYFALHADATASACPFCTLPSSRIVIANELAVVIRDAYPVVTGHTLVIPRRHRQLLRSQRLSAKPCSVARRSKA